MPAPVPFRIERYFARHEFTAPYLLSPSDCETVSVTELLDLADEDGRRRWDTLALGYTESAGHPVLRQEIASGYERVDADSVLVVSPIEGIFLAMNSLLEKGDHVIAMVPAYQALLEVARMNGVQVEPWRLEARNGRWHLDLDLLERAIRPETRMLVVNFPHNPTGFLPDRNTFEAIVDITAARGLILFSDEMYRGLEPDRARCLPSAADICPRSITLCGLSKAPGLPGLRIGWLIIEDAGLRDRCQTMKDYTSICHSGPSEILAIIGLRALDRLLDRNRAIVRANLELAEPFFATRADRFEWLAPDAGSVAFPRWLGAGSVDALAERTLSRAGLMIATGELFDMPGTHFRVGLGRRHLATALDRFAAVIDAPD